MSRKEHIGYCAWCRVLDHHIVDDMCPDCHSKVAKLDQAYAINELEVVRNTYGSAQCLHNHKLRNDPEKMKVATTFLIRNARLKQSDVDELSVNVMRIREMGLKKWVEKYAEYRHKRCAG